jgi:hypothetical protein
MDEVADLALRTYGLNHDLDVARVAQSREKIIRSIDKFAPPGKRRSSVDCVCAGVLKRIA